MVISCLLMFILFRTQYFIYFIYFLMGLYKYAGLCTDSLQIKSLWVIFLFYY